MRKQVDVQKAAEDEEKKDQNLRKQIEVETRVAEEIKLAQEL